MFKPASLLLGGLLMAATLASCVGKYQSSFTLIVENRAANSISVLADGKDLGIVASGQTGTFTLDLQESNANTFTNGVAPTAQGVVTLTAKDQKTGNLSVDKPLTLSGSTPTHVTFNASDFPATTPTVARFTSSPTNPAVNQDVTFNATSSTAINATYNWDFGDGSTGAGVTTTHQYRQPATFTVVLTVASDNGATSSSSRSVTISAALPPTAATFTFSPTTPAINQDVLFTAAGAGTVQGATYAWDFGDGAVGANATVTHRYARAGTYTASLRVTSNVGQTATSSRSLTVTSTLPAGSVAFTASPTTGGVNDIIFLNASPSTGVNLTFSWDFGDGTRGTGITTQHQYGATGTYTITLTGTNDLGQTASATRTITITATSTQLVAAFNYSPTDPTMSLRTNTVFFDASPSSATAVLYTFNYGDGTTESTTNPKQAHTYAAAGTWVVRLTIQDALGRSATTTQNVTVKP